ADIYFGSLAGGACRGAGCRDWPGGALKKIKQLFRNEPRPGGVEMAIPLGLLAMNEETLRDHEMEVVLRAGHGDVKQAAFLLDLGQGAGAEVGGYASIDDVKQVDRLPFLALGGMNGRQTEIVFVEKRYAGLVAGCIRWI